MTLQGWSLDLLAIPVFLVAVPGGEILRHNPAATALCGGPPLPAKRIVELIHAVAPDGEPVAAGSDPIALALRSGSPLRDTPALLETGGQRVAVEVSLQPVGDVGGRPAAVLVTCHDITRWQDQATALQRSEHRLAVAMDAGKLGAWQLDLQTGALVSSAQCKANHGFGPDEDLQVESHVMPAMSAEDRARLRTLLEQAISTQGSFEFEATHRWPDGSVHWLLIAGRVLDPTSMVGVSLDTTERHRLEDALRAADRRKDEFLSVVAHEMRDPLFAILTAVRVLEVKGPSEAVLQHQRDTIVRQATRLAGRVEDLLDIGRIAEGKLRLDRRRIELGAILTEAIETCASLIERRRQELKVVLPDGPVYLDADGGRIVQAVCNLLNNAAKYTRQGGRIEVAGFASSGQAVIRVRDDGMGIAPDMLDRIFERFVQIGGAGRGGEGGLGIGLALVKAIVELHGGSVEARSGGVGAGSEFTVRLPLGISEASVA